ncbi:uncharacterized protein LOC110271515 [Arachis ipaensis]|uniref:uncharacterized protein LOC110271515 n=1 Tax=Arachis ipaensis TaxID=130454 RepID=UPI000A2B798F|nr:uncharacterized protein LOC110271515 [Arachis ipaensis]
MCIWKVKRKEEGREECRRCIRPHHRRRAALESAVRVVSRREEEKRNSSRRRHPRSCELRPVAVGVTAPSSLPAPNEKHDGAPLLLPWFAVSEHRGREDDASWRLGCCCAMEQTEPRRAVGVLTVAGKGFRPPQVSRLEEAKSLRY